MFREPNDSAFLRTETRTGPSLDYVAEKIRKVIERLHDSINNIREHVPGDLPIPERAVGTGISIKTDYIESPAFSAFMNAVVAFLALNNMLALANDNKLFKRLLSWDRDHLQQWLDRIDREGSVTG